MIESLSAADAVAEFCFTDAPSGSWSPPFAERYQLSAGYFVQFIGAFRQRLTAVSDTGHWLETSLISQRHIRPSCPTALMSAPAHRCASDAQHYYALRRHLQCLTGDIFYRADNLPFKQALANNTTNAQRKYVTTGAGQTRAWPPAR